MSGKRKIIIAAITFVFAGLTIYAFANPNQDNVDKDNNSNIKEEEKNKENELDNKENENQEEPITAPVVQQPTAYDLALQALLVAEDRIDQESYNAAVELVQNATNQNLTNRLNEVKNGVDAKSLVKDLENKTKDASDLDEINAARDFRTTEQIVEKVSQLLNNNLKNALQEKLTTLADLLDDNVSPVINIQDEEILSSDTEIIVTDETDFVIKLKESNEIDYSEIPNNTVVSDGIYLLNVVDAAFNETNISFTVDTHAPQFNVVDGLISNTDVSIIVDDLTLDYVNAINNTTSQSTRKNTAQFDLTEEGAYTLVAYDKAGTSTEISILIDKTSARVTAANILVAGDSNAQREFYATNGDRISAYIRTSEELKEKPIFKLINNGLEYVVDINSISVSGPNNNGEYTYSMTYLIDQSVNMIDGEIELNVSNIQDLAGNITNNVTKPTNRHIIYLDRTAPKIETTINIRSGYQLELESNETINDLTEFTKNNSIYSKTYSELPTDLIVTDLAGNETHVPIVTNFAYRKNTSNGNWNIDLTFNKNLLDNAIATFTKLTPGNDKIFTKEHNANNDYSALVIDTEGNETTIFYMINRVGRELDIQNKPRSFQTYAAGSNLGGVNGLFGIQLDFTIKNLSLNNIENIIVKSYDSDQLITTSALFLNKMPSWSDSLQHLSSFIDFNNSDEYWNTTIENIDLRDYTPNRIEYIVETNLGFDLVETGNGISSNNATWNKVLEALQVIPTIRATGVTNFIKDAWAPDRLSSDIEIRQLDKTLFESIRIEAYNGNTKLFTTTSTSDLYDIVQILPVVNLTSSMFFVDFDDYWTTTIDTTIQNLTDMNPNRFVYTLNYDNGYSVTNEFNNYNPTAGTITWKNIIKNALYSPIKNVRLEISTGGSYNGYLSTSIVFRGLDYQYYNNMIINIYDDQNNKIITSTPSSKFIQEITPTLNGDSEITNGIILDQSDEYWNTTINYSKLELASRKPASIEVILNLNVNGNNISLSDKIVTVITDTYWQEMLDKMN